MERLPKEHRPGYWMRSCAGCGELLEQPSPSHPMFVEGGMIFHPEPSFCIECYYARQAAFEEKVRR